MVDSGTIRSFRPRVAKYRIVQFDNQTRFQDARASRKCKIYTEGANVQAKHPLLLLFFLPGGNSRLWTRLVSQIKVFIGLVKYTENELANAHRGQCSAQVSDAKGRIVRTPQVQR
jgi:hypothetical protein